MGLSAFSAESEINGPSAHLHMIVSKSREPVRIVLPRIFVVADSNRHGIEQLHNGGKDFSLAEPAAGEVFLDLSPNVRQRCSEHRHPVEFRLIANLTVG